MSTGFIFEVRRHVTYPVTQPMSTEIPIAVTSRENETVSRIRLTWLTAWACLAMAGTVFSSHGTGMNK
jgi:hypothetical protein